MERAEGGRGAGGAREGGLGDGGVSETVWTGRSGTSLWDVGAHPEVHAEKGQAVLFETVAGKRIKRWGMEGIRIGTSDRFGRGRGE